MDVLVLLGATSQALQLAKAAIDADKRIDAVVLKNRLADAEEGMANLRSALIKLKQECEDLEAENARLEKADQQLGELVRCGSHSYLTDEGGNATGYPVCPSCIHDGKRVVPLVPDAGLYGAKCPLCKELFNPVDIYVAPGLTKRAQRKAMEDETIRRASSRGWSAV